MPSTGHYPPPTRPEARYDAVVARGRRLQRRDRMRRGLVTVSAAAIVVLVLGVGVIGATRGNDVDQGPVAGPTTTDSTTTTAAPTGLQVTALAIDGAIDVDVDDPAVPSTADTKACVYVRLQPEGGARMATAETTACWSPTDGDAVTEVPLPRTVGAEIGCAASVEPATAERTEGDAESPDGTSPGSTPPAGGAPTGEVHHSFRFSLPADLPAGSYVAEVTGVTGVGDGCPTATPGDDEATASSTVGITVG